MDDPYPRKKLAFEEAQRLGVERRVTFLGKLSAEALREGLRRLRPPLCVVHDGGDYAAAPGGSGSRPSRPWEEWLAAKGRKRSWTT